MRIDRALWRWMQRFARDERGIITVQNLFLTVACCGIGAVGLDVTSFFQARTHLQVAADVGAHAALFTRHRGRSEAEAKTAAINVASYGVPNDFGTVLSPSDISFGTWNAATSSFAPLPSGSTDMPSAARVVTDRAGDNPVSSFLFRIVGVNSMNVRAAAVYTTYYPCPFHDGIAAKVAVEITSLNSFFDDLCVHGEQYVELKNGNTFGPGTYLSMNDTSVLADHAPNDYLTKNDGLAQALRSGSYDFRILELLKTSAMNDSISSLGSTYTPSYLRTPLSTSTTTSGTGRDFVPTDFAANTAHRYTCNSDSQTITLTGGTYQNFVLITNCQIKISGKVNLENAIVSTTNNASKSVSFDTGGGANNRGLVLGKDDNCADGGGASIITRGGVEGSAALTFYGGQILALGDVQFAAQPVAQGVSIVSGGTVSGTTQMNFRGCPRTGMDDVLEAAYFRLAQ
jgi:Flp pilus assembly protein TadG